MISTTPSTNLPRESWGRLITTLLLWAVWHLPLFWIPGTGSGYGLVDFT